MAGGMWRDFAGWKLTLLPRTLLVCHAYSGLDEPAADPTHAERDSCIGLASCRIVETLAGTSTSGG